PTPSRRLLPARWPAVGAAARQPGEQGAHRDPGGALGQVAVVGLGPGRAGDVEVDPGTAVDELLEEQAGETGAAAAVADVLEVGQVALDVLAVLGGQGQAP